MKTKIDAILNSDLLERYLLGETSALEDMKVEHLLEEHPEVRAAYSELEDSIAALSSHLATPMPQDVKDKVMQEIAKSNTGSESKEGSSLPWYFIAASAASLVFAVATLQLWNQNKLLHQSNEEVASQIDLLKQEVLQANSSLENVKSKFAVLNNPDTKKYYIVGNERAKNLRSVAYINPKEKLTAINIISMPEIPAEKEVKMWAEVNGEMVCLGTLERADKKLMAFPFRESVTNFKITIETKGNNDFATIDSEIADLKID